MATAKELRIWAATIRQWAERLDDARAAESGQSFATELDRLALCKEVADRQLV